MRIKSKIMNPRDIKKYPIVWTNNLSQPIFVGDFRDIDLTIVGTGNVVVLGSAERNDDDAPPDFSSPSTITNSYAAMVVADLTTVNTYTTALAVAGATKIGEVNTNLLTWICLSRSTGTVDAFVTATDNS